MGSLVTTFISTLKILLWSCVIASKGDSFRYLDLLISMGGEINEDVEQRIRVGWLREDLPLESFVIGAFQQD